jgi:amino acid adenylation domain-containing protein
MRFPASFSQRRLWFLDQLQPGEPTYNLPYAIWLDGPLDAQALQRALDALVARHSILRTRIVAIDGEPEQLVSETGAAPIERIGFPAEADSAERIRRAESIAADLGRQPFNLAAGQLIRAALIGAGPDRHLFLLVMHYVIGDSAALEVLVRELSATYRAETTGAPASLAPLWMEYGDYAVWQQDQMRGEELDRQLSYWRDQLRGAPRLLMLPSDRPRPAQRSSRGAVARVTIDAATTQRLATVAHGANASMFMVFLTGFVAVLSRYARETDVVIGTQVPGRTHAELDAIIGLFTNLVPLRMSLSGDPSFSGLLCRVRDTALAAMAHQQVPFEKLVEELAPDRTLAHWPLVQVQFVYGFLTPPQPDLPGITSRSTVLPTGTAKFDLTMYVDALDGQATMFSLEYSTDLFDQGWAERFLGCMAQLLDHAAHAPGTAVADLPMLSAAEVDAQVTGRNRHALPARDDNPDVRRLLQASTSCVIDGDGAVPMSLLCDRAARVARALADSGVGSGTPVGLCLEPGIGMLTALLSVWWAGGAFVPLDPGFPPARLTAMARGVGLRFVVADTAHRDLARSVADGAAVTCVDDSATAAGSALDPVAMPSTALAYILFTSGSTRLPQGVGVQHRAVANLIAYFQGAFGLGSDDRFVSVTTLLPDIAILELLLPAICDADLVIAAADDARDPGRLRSLIERTAATAMQATPQIWRMLESTGDVPACLRLRMTIGERLQADLADHLMAPGVTLWNFYGPTETTVYSAGGVVATVADAAVTGPPIDRTRVYVLDDHLMPVPAGVVGEVCLADRGVARGYVGRPRLTARSFRPDPWSHEPGARMYLTGDLGRWREGGSLELIGRNDHQVTIGGSRIECGEIESVLRAHRDVRQAVVVTATRAGEPALVAYIVPRRGSATAQPGTDLLKELQPHLRAALPEHMIPALVVALPSLPLTPDAKVDRSALPPPRLNASPSASDYVEPRNPVEATFARIWSELLATKAPIGVHDNLFELGCHSLTAAKFVARVAHVYKVSLPVREVFAAPTIAGLAEVVSADPEFGHAAAPYSHAELDALSDEDLDALLRAALAERNRRRASTGGTDS